VLARERVELADAALPGCRQPYHALEGLPLAQARAGLARFEAAAAAHARTALDSLRARAAAAGGELRRAGILDASGRSGATLEAILASHALIHTADGQHFRAALQGACAARGIEVVRIAQRALPAQAADALRRSGAELSAAAAALGRGLGAPWGADQKAAVLLGWLLLA